MNSDRTEKHVNHRLGGSDESGTCQASSSIKSEQNPVQDCTELAGCQERLILIIGTWDV